MKYMKYNWLMLLFVLWAGCRKDDLPPGAPGDPVFTAQFAFDSEEHLIRAGVEQVYLFTKYRQDPGPVMVLSGAFAQADCPDATCPGSLSFEFRNYRTGTQVFPDTLFVPGNIEYRLQDPGLTDIIYRVTFSTPDTLDYDSFEWRIDNQLFSTNKMMVRDFTDQSRHLVSLTASSGNAVKSYVTRTVVANTTSFYPEVGITIGPSDSIPGLYLLKAEAQNIPVAVYKWSTGDSLDQIFIDSPLEESYSVRLGNPSADTAYALIYSFNQGAINKKTADFTYSVEEIPLAPDTLQLDRVNIRWIDTNGIAWESQKGAQNTDAFFQVLDSSPYENNENGQETWKMTVSFSCLVYNTSNPSESKPMNGTAVIAVAYP